MKVLDAQGETTCFSPTPEILGSRTCCDGPRWQCPPELFASGERHQTLKGWFVECWSKPSPVLWRGLWINFISDVKWTLKCCTRYSTLLGCWRSLPHMHIQIVPGKCPITCNCVFVITDHLFRFENGSYDVFYILSNHKSSCLIIRGRKCKSHLSLFRKMLMLLRHVPHVCYLRSNIV